MRTGFNNDQPKRPIVVDFELYTDGDLEFKKELIILMINDLNELRAASIQALDEKSPELFSRACHKVKVTLVMLSDPDLQAAIEQITSQGMIQEKISDLTKLIDELIMGLLAVDK